MVTTDKWPVDGGPLWRRSPIPNFSTRSVGPTVGRCGAYAGQQLKLVMRLVQAVVVVLSVPVPLAAIAAAAAGAALILLCCAGYTCVLCE